VAIMGKARGCKFTESSADNISSLIYAEPAAFTGYKFMSPGGDFVEGLSRIEYYPRAYPYHRLASLAPAAVARVVERLEAFPALGGKPAFDHYRVIVPGLFYPSYFQRPPYHFVDPSGVRLEFDSMWEAQQALDAAMIETKTITPVLVGERDGDHYFICYWL
jgi:hypothetical protein